MLHGSNPTYSMYMHAPTSSSMHVACPVFKWALNALKAARTAY